MKRNIEFILNTILVLAVTLLIAVMPTEAEAAIYDDTVRLHILASSDSERDQDLKLEIRNRVLAKYGDILGNSGSRAKAVEEIERRKDEIQKDVEAWIEELGEGYGARVEIGTEWYDTRVYESFTLPCGYYTSLRILLGNGEGQNWWCVMYPPLCLDVATSTGASDIGYTKEETVLIRGGKYNIKFKILELLSETAKDLS